MKTPFANPKGEPFHGDFVNLAIREQELERGISKYVMVANIAIENSGICAP